jgi:RimJ/RimL family protein N-acetyltransferase
MTSEALVAAWPAAGVRVQAGDLELRWMDDDLIVSLAQRAVRGVHDPAYMPFGTPWTRGTPEQITRSVMAYQWSTRSKVGPDAFTLELAVLVNGVLVGSQGARAQDWSGLRSAETGSWLGREFQGNGIGARMRVLMLHLLFEGLGADEATSSAFADNAASNAVSRKVGYLPVGTERIVREGIPAIQNRYRMSRVTWLAMRDVHEALLGAPVVLTGVSALRDQLETSPQQA